MNSKNKNMRLCLTDKPYVSENMCAPAAPAPSFALPSNTQGIGNAVPPTEDAPGSGDRWDNKTEKKKKTKPIDEESINPFDKIGTQMAAKLGVSMYFETPDNKTVKQSKDKYKITTLDDYTKNK